MNLLNFTEDIDNEEYGEIQYIGWGASLVDSVKYFKLTAILA